MKNFVITNLYAAKEHITIQFNVPYYKTLIKKINKKNKKKYILKVIFNQHLEKEDLIFNTKEHNVLI